MSGKGKNRGIVEAPLRLRGDTPLHRAPETPPVGPRTILLVDDDLGLCSLIVEFLNPCGFKTDTVHDGSAAIARAMTKNYDLILLDVMLPLQDGFEVLRQIRKQSGVPIIMLTARSEQEDRVTGLNLGADDYLGKPFGPQELVARIRAVLRRTDPAPSDSGCIRVRDISLNAHARAVSKGGREIELTSYEFDILAILMRSAGRVVSRDEIAAVLYKRDSTPFERAIDVHVCHLRRKIEIDGRTWIRTVRGSGYVFAVLEDE